MFIVNIGILFDMVFVFVFNIFEDEFEFLNFRVFLFGEVGEFVVGGF